MIDTMLKLLVTLMLMASVICVAIAAALVASDPKPATVAALVTTFGFTSITFMNWLRVTR